MPSRSTPARRTQQQRRADTRAQLLSAAAQVFADHGYAGASVGEICRAASCSTGALYAHFSSKADLFLTLLDQGIPSWGAGYANETTGETVDSRLRAAVAHWGRIQDRHPQITMLYIEFWSAAMRDSELREDFAARQNEIKHQMTTLIEQAAHELDITLPQPAATLGTIVTALADGFALQRLTQPESTPTDMFLTALRLLLQIHPPQ